MLMLRSRAPAPRPLPPQNAALHLIGFTNINPNGRFASFAISNETLARFCYVLTGFACKTPDGWTAIPLDRTSPHWLDFGDGCGGVLDAGSAVLFHVPVLLTNAPWRFHISCQEYATGIDGLTDRARDFVRNVKETNPMVGGSMIFKGRRYELVSPEISE